MHNHHKTRAKSLIVILLLFQIVQARKYARCELVRELLKQNYEKTFISNWVCLIEQESNKDSTTVTRLSNGSTNYGLFQINSKEWCKEGKKGGKCNVSCQDLLDDNIKSSATCAKMIFNEEGFKFWSGWVKRCKGQRLPDVEKCPDFASPRTTPEKDPIKNRYGRSIISKLFKKLKN